MTMRTGLAGYCAWAAPATNSKSSAMVLIRSPHGEHFRAGHRHLGSEDLAVGRIGDVQRLAAKSDVGHQPMLLPPVGEVRRQAVRVEAPDADAEVADDETVFIVDLDAVGTGVTARELDRDAGLGWRAARHERQAPDLLRARDGHVHLAVLLVQRDAVRRWRVRHQLLELTVRPESPDASRGIGDAALALVGEIELAVVGEVQVVQALEALAERGFHHRLDARGLGIER